MTTAAVVLYLIINCKTCSVKQPSLINETDEIRQVVVRKLASDGGLSRIKDLFVLIRDESLSADQQKSFIKDSLMPFYSIFARQEIAMSMVLETHLRTISHWLYGDGSRVVPIFQATIQVLMEDMNGSSDWICEDANASSLNAFLSTFSVVTKYNQDAIVNKELIAVAELLEAFFNADTDRLIRTSPDGLRAKGTFHRLQRQLKIGKQMPDTSDKVDHNADHGRATFEVQQDGPGELSPLGPRHDNDHQDTTKIKLMPTDAEITSTRTEYMPRSNLFGLHLKGARGLIDRQFRLVREDNVGQLRDAVKAEIERQRAFALGNPVRSGSNRGARTSVYYGGRLENLAPHDLRGLQCDFMFRQPWTDIRATKEELRKKWEDKGSLTPGTLVCLLDAQHTVLFAEVIRSEPKGDEQRSRASPNEIDERLYVNSNEATISLAIVDADEDTNNALFERFGHQPGTQTLVEFPGILLASFAPTLKALQRLSEDPTLPFANIIAPEERPSSLLLDIEPPAYAMSRDFQYKLDDVLSEGHPMSFSVHDVFDSQSFREHSTFDEGQSDAIRDALSRQLALIQGPPGTGKSYTGLSLIKILLQNQEKAKLGPILVVCYTNHALDQILESVYHAGTTSGIVRMGSRSKSAILEGVNLGKLRHLESNTSTERSQHWVSCSLTSRNICAGSSAMFVHRTKCLY